MDLSEETQAHAHGGWRLHCRTQLLYPLEFDQGQRQRQHLHLCSIILRFLFSPLCACDDLYPFLISIHNGESSALTAGMRVCDHDLRQGIA